MFENKISASELTGLLSSRGCISEEQGQQIETFLAREDQKTEIPETARKLSGCGAWFATFFFLGFFGYNFLRDESSTITVGILMMIAAVIVQINSDKNPFTDQLTLSWAVTGNVMIQMGLTGMRSSRPDDIGIFFLVQLLICAVTYPLYDHYVFRMGSSVAAALLAMTWAFSMTESSDSFFFLHLFIAILTIGAGSIGLNKRRASCLDPLMYALFICLPITFLTLSLIRLRVFPQKNFHPSLWPSSVILSIAIIYLIGSIAGSLGRLREPKLAAITGSIVLLGCITNPGILVSIGILIFAFELDDRNLFGMSYSFIAVFLFFYYYDLNVSLAYKSWIIGGSGAVLLGLRMLLKRLPHGEE